MATLPFKGRVGVGMGFQVSRRIFMGLVDPTPILSFPLRGKV